MCLLKLYNFWGMVLRILIKKKNVILQWLLTAGCVASGLVALWFLYAQTFLIHSYCLFCVNVDIISLGLLGMGIYFIVDYFKKRK